MKEIEAIMMDLQDRKIVTPETAHAIVSAMLYADDCMGRYSSVEFERDYGDIAFSRVTELMR